MDFAISETQQAYLRLMITRGLELTFCQFRVKARLSGKAPVLVPIDTANMLVVSGLVEPVSAGSRKKYRVSASGREAVSG